MTRYKFLSALLMVFALGAFLRFEDLAGPSLWLDEILHLEVARSLSEVPLYSYLIGVREVDGGTENGSLYYLLQILGQRIAPGDLGVRLFPALIGTLTLPLMAWAGHLLGGRLLALVATLLLAVSPLHVYFSREGRPYYLLMALALVLLCALLQRGTRTGTRTAYVGCLLGAYVGIHSIPLLLSFLVLAGSGMLVGTLRQRRDRVALRRSPFLHLVLAAGLGLALAFGLYMTRSQTNTPTRINNEAQAEFQESPVFESPLSQRSRQRFLASMTTSGHPSVLMSHRSWLLLAMAVLGLVLEAPRARSNSDARSLEQLLFVLGMFILPTVLSFSALMAVGRWYGIRYTSSAQPAFLLLVAIGILTSAMVVADLLRLPETKRLWANWSTAGLLVLGLVAPNVMGAREDPYRKLDWRGVADFFDRIALEGEPIVVPNEWPRICLDYYLKQIGREVEFVSIWETAARGDAVVAERPMGWLLTAGYRKSNEARAWMHGFVPVLKKREEEMALFFFPDAVTLLESRFDAGKGEIFEQRFDEIDRRFEFGGGETTLQGWGWSYAENDGAGMDFQWAVGEQAELGLPIGQPRDARIRLRAQPFVFPDAPGQELEIWLNETLLTSLELPDDWSEHEIEVPRAAWHSGANILYLRFSRSTRPSSVIEGAGDRRPLSAAFDYLEVL